MLMADGESIDMNGNRNDNFASAIWRRSAISHVVGRQTSFDSFPFRATVLEPNFNLEKLIFSKKEFRQKSLNHHLNFA